MGTDPKNLVGTTLSGRYRIEKAIGEGGMGAIFEATQLSLGRMVAIKVVKTEHAEGSDAMRRFERETEAIARLQHPNIVQVVDAGRAEDGTMYLAMELIHGETVRMAVRRDGVLAWPRALAIVEDVASALVAAHGAGIIHRDLKAENVMLVRAAGRSETAKVLDFGVAKLTSRTEAPPQTGSGFVAGTPGCIAPEQMLGKGDDPRSDLYSLGVMLFEMLAGEPPFLAANTMELMLRHLSETAPRCAQVARTRGRPEVPGALDDLVASLLAKRPEERPATAQALADVCRALRDTCRATMGEVPLPTPSPSAPAPHAPLQPAITAPTPGASGAPGMPSVPTMAAPLTPGGSPLPGWVPGTPIPPEMARAIALAMQQAGTPLTGLAPAPGAGAAGAITAGTPGVPVPAPPPAEKPVPLLLRPLAKLRSAPLGVRMAFGTTLGVVLCASLAMWLNYFADRTIGSFNLTTHDDWELWDSAREKYWNLDLAGARADAQLLVSRDPQVPFAHMLLGQIRLTEKAPLSRVDEHFADAIDAARERAKATPWARTHTERFLEVLTTFDLRELARKWPEHVAQGQCGHEGPLERQLVASRLAVAGPQAGEGAIVELFRAVNGADAEDDVDDLYPAQVVGIATGLRHDGKLVEATALLERLQKRIGPVPTVVEALVDVDLARGLTPQALTRLDALLRQNDDVRSKTRKALLETRAGDADAFARVIERVRDDVDGPRKVDALSNIGFQLASLGRLQDASAIWKEAVKVAGNDDARALEQAAVAVLFAIMAGEPDVAADWMNVVNQRTPRVDQSKKSSARVRGFALAGRVLMATYSGKPEDLAEAQRDFDVLKGVGGDVVSLATVIAWHLAHKQEKHAEAAAVAESLPPCMKAEHIGMSLRMQGKLEEARAQLLVAASDDLRNRCTAGDEVISYSNGIIYANALAVLAHVEMLLGNAEGARAAVAKHRQWWPHPQLPPKGPLASSGQECKLELIMGVQEWLAGVPAGAKTAPPPPWPPPAAPAKRGD